MITLHDRGPARQGAPADLLRAVISMSVGSAACGASSVTYARRDEAYRASASAGAHSTSTLPLSPERLTVCNRSTTWLVTLLCAGGAAEPDRGLTIRVGPLSQVVWRSDLPCCDTIAARRSRPAWQIGCHSRGLPPVVAAQGFHNQFATRVRVTGDFRSGLANGGRGSSGQTSPFSSASSDDDGRTHQCWEKTASFIA